MVTCLMNCLCENVGSTNDHELRKPSNFYLFQLYEQNTNCKSFVSVVKHTNVKNSRMIKNICADKYHYTISNRNYEIIKSLVV